MKIFKALLLASALLALPVAVQAQPGDADDATQAARVQKKTDKLWAKSDQAFHDGDYKTAITYHKQIQELDPHDVESFSVSAWLMWSLGENEQALAQIERGLKVNGADWDMWDEAGQHYQLQIGRDADSPLLPKMLEAFNRAVELLPADANKNDAMMLRRRLAHAAEKNKNYDLALATWRKLVEDYPNDQVNKNNLARLEGELKADKKSDALTVA